MEKNSDKSGFSVRKRLQSFRYAANGILNMIKTQPNFQIHLVIFAVVILSGIILQISKTDWILVIIVAGFVLSAEAMNTAVEKLTDLVQPETDPKAGLIKDLAAGAVLLAALAAALTGLLIFAPKILALL